MTFSTWKLVFSSMWVVLFLETSFLPLLCLFEVYASTFRNEWLGVVYARFPFFFLRLTQHTSISDQKTASPHENNLGIDNDENKLWKESTRDDICLARWDVFFLQTKSTYWGNGKFNKLFWGFDKTKKDDSLCQLYKHTVCFNSKYGTFEVILHL